jgi:hypothetical protein
MISADNSLYMRDAPARNVAPCTLLPNKKHGLHLKSFVQDSYTVYLLRSATNLQMRTFTHLQVGRCVTFFQSQYTGDEVMRESVS